MSSSQNNDGDERFALGLVFALIILVVLGVVWFGAYKGIHGAKSGKAAVTATASGSKGGAVLGGTDPAVAAARAAEAANAAAATGAAAANGAAVIADDAAAVVIENGVVKFYFATAKAELAPGANEALVDVIAGVKAGQRAVISGYTDATGDADKNAELAKQRAFAVRDALLALGVTEDKLELKKPEAVENAGNNAQARRVEVVLAP
ncbi:OmpA family protein [Comamonas sp. JUb58]|uniref:OmpA family protein n=1 Tax=Comamonas sp. JUb58 TaxID=2485114 RepID=UPI0010E1E28A|nr:OmpA family protein [Comamonas sp. JUb58]TDS74079.1 outer membrane protein OmpA-like peptidoglycan-associated protein [Comamonas sp. JUb58]